MRIWQEAVKKSSQWAAGLGPGAGTGEELNKQGKADEAAENKKGAGKAAEGK